jgi:transposase-like protein DUF772
METRFLTFLLRAQLIQMLYSVRSERLLMEEIDYSVLFRWFVGMNLDEPVWDVTGCPPRLQWEPFSSHRWQFAWLTSPSPAIGFARNHESRSPLPEPRGKA